MLAYIPALLLAALGVTSTLSINSPVNVQMTEMGNDPLAPNVGMSQVAYSEKDAKFTSSAASLVVYSNTITQTLLKDVNATFKNGTLPNTAITFPSGYVNEGWTHYVEDKGASGRYVYSYIPFLTINNVSYAGMANAMSIVTRGDYLAGEARDGKLYTSSAGMNNAITLPPQARIPNGSPLYISIVK